MKAILVLCFLLTFGPLAYNKAIEFKDWLNRPSPEQIKRFYHRVNY